MEFQKIKEAIFIFAYNEALDDATRQRAFLGKKDEVKQNKKARDLVKKYIDAMITGTHLNFYETAQKVETAIGIKDFTFGNVQKLVNMTVKYFFISCYCDIRLRSAFDQAHCPMDREMKDTVFASYKEAVEKENAPQELMIFVNEKGKESMAWPSLSWSGITREYVDLYPENNAYARFQAMVTYLAGKKGLSPIEYDYLKWKNP